MKNWDTFLEFALELARTAEKEILPRFRRCSVNLKSDGTVVTEADREAERAMRHLIEKSFPDHGILGEEWGEKKAAGEEGYRWILDPVDGTASFCVGLPHFGTLIALAKGAEPILGVIALPVMREILYAAKGDGCWFQIEGETPLRVSVAPSVLLDQAAVSVTGFHSSDIRCEAGEIPYGLSRVARKAKKIYAWGDCIHHTLVARGKIHAAIDPVMKPWDIAALVPCLEEAGGKVTSLQGDRKGLLESGSFLSSCGGPLHEQILQLLQPLKREA